MRALAMALLLLPGSGADAATPATPIGLWQNPKGTIIVQTRPCGQLLCGNIVWAGPGAVADAREAGVNRLVGTELLSDYRASGAGRWTGRVYVPDQGRRYYSTIELRTPNSLRISGCILGGLICKRQDWIRK
ncbi:MAG TPA: DUF2147 domain-containing protein [Sphingopyxis sp.]|uniref:DUF2147 domain-containing protein n=1 Tax=Sphingopyxis sp. TaxID=1908224 RepID=UPI002C669EF6|nr:DUF2147 domain-containing protein [Sphingopyxis sp.]HWW57332.1 DUF2147 domain-containing protein [Sphingopyxis sp.]